MEPAGWLLLHVQVAQAGRGFFKRSPWELRGSTGALPSPHRRASPWAPHTAEDAGTAGRAATEGAGSRAWAERALGGCEPGVWGQVPRGGGEASGGGAASFPPLEGSHSQKTRGPPGAGPAAGAGGREERSAAGRRGAERSPAPRPASTPLSGGGERGKPRARPSGEPAPGSGLPRDAAVRGAAGPGPGALPLPCAPRTRPLGGGGARARPGAGGARRGRAAS